MNLYMNFNEHYQIRSIIHCWDIRFKSISIIFFILVAAYSKNLLSLFFCLAISILLVILAKIPLKSIIKIMFPLILVILFILPVFLITSRGPVWFSLGIIPVYKQGLLMSIVISIRAISIVLSFFTLFSSEKLIILIKSWEYFKISPVLTSIFLFTYRFIFLFSESLIKLNQAASLRGLNFARGLVHFKTTTGIFISLLIRGYEQSERTANAMQLRGFDLNNKSKISFKSWPADYLKTSILFFICILIIIIELTV